MDPLTAMAAASAAYRGIKKACELTKSVAEMSGTIAKFAKATSDIDFLEQKAKKPRLFQMFGDTEATALDLWSKKQKILEYRTELKNHISFVYGPSAWKAICKIEAEQRKIQKEMVHKRQDFIDDCISWAVGIALTTVFGGLLGGALYIFMLSTGRW
tara:strand:- start:611 stop:1081 length:471 start_codon:yes stop_codon:yes gene_type:complete